MKYHLTKQSGNVKTGPIPVSTSGAQTCPEICPLKNSGCYAASGPLGMHWRKVTDGKRGDDWSEFLARVSEIPVGQAWRHNQAGDLPGEGDRIDREMLMQLVSASNGRKGWTYTHKPVAGGNGFHDSAIRAQNASAIRQANSMDGMTVNLSANNLAHADLLCETGAGPVVVVVAIDSKPVTYTPAGRKVVVCPAQQREGVTCADCMLCSKQRSVIVGFRAHGASRRKAEGIACEGMMR